MRFRFRGAAAVAILLSLVSGAADARDPDRPDAHAPIGVMGDHIHHEGEVMLSYRFMTMHMDGNRDGTSREKLSDILLPDGTYRAAPTEMNMDMHMIGAMYAPKDWVTLMVMFPFVALEMDHRTAMGQRFTTRSSGLGDIRTSALVELWGSDRHQLLLNAGVSWPSGSIERKDDTPASGGSSTLLPYPMQLGSGTVDLLPGLTYTGQAELFSWGGQAMGTVRLGRNSENYRLGDRYQLTAWGAVAPIAWLSGGVRAEFGQWFDISGRDDGLADPMGIPAEDFVPTAEPNRRAGKRLDIGPSLNFLAKKGPLAGIRLAFEMLFPVYQDLNGPQLETDWVVTSGVQYAF